MSDHSQLKADAGSRSPASWTPRQLKFLTTAVAIMSVVLVVGLAVVVGRIIYLSKQSSGQAGVLSPPGSLRPASHLELPAGAVVRNISINGAQLAVHYEDVGGGGIAIMDLASGRIISRVALGALPPAK